MLTLLGLRKLGFSRSHPGSLSHPVEGTLPRALSVPSAFDGEPKNKNRGTDSSGQGQCGQVAPQGPLESGEGLSYPNHHPSNEELDFSVCGKTCRT